MQVENRAGIRLLAPGQKALIVALDKTYSAINQLDLILAEILSDLTQEALQGRSWDVNLRDQLRRRKRGVELVVDFAVVIVWIDTQLVEI